MTIKEIAELATVSESTVRNWITSAKTAEVSAKTAKAKETSVAADFTLYETLAIIRAGGNDTLADLLAMNATQNAHEGVTAVTNPSPVSPAQKAKELPSAAKLRETRIACEKGMITKAQLVEAWGLTPNTRPKSTLEEAPLSPETLAIELRKVYENGQ